MYIDRQSINGKVPINVARLAKKYDKKVISIFGAVDYFENNNIDFSLSLCNKPMTLEDAIASTENKLYNSIYGIIKLLEK